jgi:hypothetical protein
MDFLGVPEIVAVVGFALIAYAIYRGVKARR